MNAATVKKLDEIRTTLEEALGLTEKKKAKLGTGTRFKALTKSLKKRGDIKDPGALAAWIGRKKYGKKKFQKMAAKGRK